MAEQCFNLDASRSKEERYQDFLSQFSCFIEGIDEPVSIYANASAALREAFGFFWVGFYLVKGERLVVGPFQGSAACSVILKGRGVCGSAWAEKRTLVVPDVDAFPGHIACSSLSRSEIVIPLFHEDEVIAVLDIDSKKLADFDEVDRIYLEKVAQMISRQAAINPKI